ncbi:MAG: hypothetical protein ACRDLB_02415 [Actinomycetota bacterium]
MRNERSWARRLIGLVAAFSLAFSGVGALGATMERTEEKQLSADAKAKKCKKSKKGKKCKPVEEGFVPGRVLELRYESSAIGSQDTPAIYPGGPLFPVNFVPGIGEEMAMIEVIDDFTPNASLGFSWDSDGDGLNDMGFDVCGKTEEPVAIEPGTQYNGFPYLLPSTTCSDAVATSGTIIITFNEV